jgi:hypothetical protein
MAGLTEIPAVIRDGDDQGRLVEAVVENVQREDLDPLEEAAAYRSLMEDFGLNHEQVATRVGKSRSTVTNSVRLLGLPGHSDPARCREDQRRCRPSLLGTDDTAYAVESPTRPQPRVGRCARWKKRCGPPGGRPREKKPPGRKDRAAQIIALEERLGSGLAHRSTSNTPAAVAAADDPLRLAQ